MTINTKTKQPIGTWIILFVYFPVTLLGLYSYYFLYFSEENSAYRQLQPALSSLPLAIHALSLSIIFSNIAACITLFKKRKFSMYLFSLSLLGSCINAAWRGFNHPEELGTLSFYISLVGLAIQLLVFSYSYFLLKRGLLH